MTFYLGLQVVLFVKVRVGLKMCLMAYFLFQTIISMKISTPSVAYDTVLYPDPGGVDILILYFNFSVSSN